jgi:hypothetical protein
LRTYRARTYGVLLRSARADTKHIANVLVGPRIPHWLLYAWRAVLRALMCADCIMALIVLPNFDFIVHGVLVGHEVTVARMHEVPYM